ncbi:MAG: hypothetical protein AAB673_01250 [Patescibacteria group bacterium]
MSEKFHREPGPNGLEYIRPKEEMTVKQVLKEMKKEGLRPVTLKKFLETMGYDQKETNEYVEALEEASDKEKK